MKSKSKMLILVFVISIVSGCGYNENATYTSSHKVINTKDEDNKLFEKVNSEGDGYFIVTGPNLFELNNNFLLSYTTDDREVITFINEKTDWRISTAYKSKLNLRLHDLKSGFDHDVDILALLIERKYVDDEIGLERTEIYYDENGDLVLICSVSQRLKESDLKYIEDSQTNPPKGYGRFDLPEEFQAQLVVINLSKYGDAVRNGEDFDTDSHISKIEDTTQLRKSEIKIDIDEVPEEISNDYTMYGKSLLSKYTNFGDLFSMSQVEGEGHSTSLVDLVRVSFEEGKPVYTFGFMVKITDIENRKLYTIFSELEADIEVFKENVLDPYILFRFVSIQSDDEIISLLAKDPDSIVIDDRLEFKEHYQELAVDTEFNSVEEVREFLSSNRTDAMSE